MTYTPGPWLNELHASDRKVGKGDFAWVCEVRTQIGALIAHVYANDKSVCEDQARLIAASPMMLKALKEMILLVDDMMPNIANGVVQNYQRLNEAPLNARAAIDNAIKE